MKQVCSVRQIILPLMLLATTPLKAQEYVPTQWYRIRAPHVDLIFKGNIHREAQRLANTLEQLYEPVSRSLGAPPAPIPLTLWDQRCISNGFFTFRPRRIEFGNGPSQDYNFIGTNDWFSILAVHEFRHAVQFAKLNRNFNQLFYWLGGEMGLEGITATLVPPWFLEGDAVGIETALTQSGRGRIPYFSRLYKTNLLERGGFPYCKQIFRSFKHAIPDHYKIGYYLTTHLRRRYGADVCANILEKTTWLVPLPIAVKQATGKSLLQIYEDANQELKGLWQKQLEGLQLTPATSMMTRSNETYTDYSYPQLDEAGQLIVLKSGLGTVAQFVLLDSQKQEHSILVPGKISKVAGFSVAQGQIVWIEEIPDPRWSDRSYSVIQRYDMQKKQLKTLTHKSRYGAAALSPDATKIVALESDEGYNHQLLILDAANGQALQRLPNPDNHYYLTPRWSEDGKQIVVVKHVQQKATIARIDLSTGATQDLLPYSENHVGLPVMRGQYVFYNSPYSGIDNIYAVDLTTHQQYQVTSRKYGAYNPAISADGRWIFFNDFTKDGMDVVQMPFAPQQWKPLEEVEDRSVRYYAPLVTQENNGDVLEHVPSQKYPVAPYYPGEHLFNLHSWPLHETFKDTKRRLGLTIRSNDLLHTTKLQAGYLYDVQKYARETFAQLSYQGWYPVFTLAGYLKKDYQRLDTTKIGALTLALPFTFKQGQYTNKVSLSTTSNLGNNAQLSYFQQTYQGQVTRTAKQSCRDLYPPWQQHLTVSYSHTPYRKEGTIDSHKQKLIVQTVLKFPGLFKHHSLSFIPKCKLKNVGPPNIGKFLIYRSVEKTCEVEATYAWPLCYPDWSLGGCLYVQRLKAHLFFQPEYRPAESLKYKYQVGLYVTMDMGLVLPISIPFIVGGAVVYNKKQASDIGLSLNLIFNP